MSTRRSLFQKHSIKSTAANKVCSAILASVLTLSFLSLPRDSTGLKNHRLSSQLKAPERCVQYFWSQILQTEFMINIKGFTLPFLSLIIISLSCTSNSQKIDIDQNIDVVRKYHEIWSNGKVEELDKIIAPNFKSIICKVANEFIQRGVNAITATNTC